MDRDQGLALFSQGTGCGLAGHGGACKEPGESPARGGGSREQLTRLQRRLGAQYCSQQCRKEQCPVRQTTPKARKPFSSDRAMTVPVAKALQSFKAPDTNVAHIRAGLRSLRPASSPCASGGATYQATTDPMASTPATRSISRRSRRLRSSIPFAWRRLGVRVKSTAIWSMRKGEATKAATTPKRARACTPANGANNNRSSCRNTELDTWIA